MEGGLDRPNRSVAEALCLIGRAARIECLLAGRKFGQGKAGAATVRVASGPRAAPRLATGSRIIQALSIPG
ncbi:hypothetical protein M2163_009182 [Streptomyces sp. SAI-135]|nr:hypothetical protein [Streptomyces sp. SAI-135]